MSNIITKIEIQKRNKDRVNIYLNGEFAFACSSGLVYYHNLKNGMVVDLKKLSEIVEEDNYIKGKNSALKILEKSFKTEKEMYDKLLQKEYDIKTVDRIMEFLKSYSFINDDKYAELYVKEKIRVQGKGKIRYSLLNKGIDEDKINFYLNNISSEEEMDIAYKLGEKKYKLLCKSENSILKLKKKLGDYLLRNGYNFEIVNEVLNKLVVEEDDKEVIEETSSDFDELMNIASKRFNIITKSESDSKKQYKKLHDYLLRRGYKYDEIKEVLKELF